MIDLAPYAAPAIAAAFGLVGGGLLFLGTRKPKAPEYGTEMPPRPRYAAAMPDGKIEFVGLDIVKAAKPRFIVPKAGQGGTWQVHERHQASELFTPLKETYARRSSALRAARRLNAKDEMERKAETSWASPR